MQRIGVIIAFVAVMFIFSGVACGDGCGGCGGSNVYIHGGHYQRRGFWGWGYRRRGFWGRRRGFRSRGFGGRGFRSGGRGFGK